MRFPSWRQLTNDQHSYYLFSPTLSSLLILREHCFEVKYLDNPKAIHGNRLCYCEQFSADGTYVVTAPCGGQVVTITNLDTIYSCSIKPGFSVCGLALTKNILLVHGHNKVVGWQLTEAGMVYEASGDGVLDQDGQLWTVSVPENDVCFWVGGCIGAISSSTEHPFCYNTETGEELEPIPIEVFSSSAFFCEVFNSRPSQYMNGYSFSYDKLYMYGVAYEHSLQDSIPWCEGGWVKYPQGKHQHKFWLPSYWRHEWGNVYWLNDVTTLRFELNNELVIIIKFHLESPLS